MKLNFKLSLKPPFIIHEVSKSAFSLEYFNNKYGVEIFSYPIFKKGKCNYDSFIKIGYQYQILQPNKDSKSCYHIDFRFFELFPENLLDMEDEDYNTINNDSDELLSITSDIEDINAVKNNDGNIIAETLDITRINNMADYLNSYSEQDKPIIAKMLRNGELKYACR